MAESKKRRLKGRSNTSDTRTKKPVSDEKKIKQLLWRLGELTQREKRKVLTYKNGIELENIRKQIEHVNAKLS